MELHSRLVHAEPGQRVVAVRALEQGRALGSALGEGPTAELAEERAIARLLARLLNHQPAQAPVQPLPTAIQPAPVADRPAATAAGASATGISATGISATGVSATGVTAADVTAAAVTTAGGSAADAPPVPTRTSPAGATGAPAAEAAAGRPTRPGGAAGVERPREGVASPLAPPGQVPVEPPGEASIDASPEPARAATGEPALAAPQEVPGEPPPDPEDWSGELAAIERALKRLGWAREQEAVYLERAFGHPSRSRLTTYADLLAYLRALEAMTEGEDPAQVAVPLRRRDLLAQSDQLLAQLGWGAEQGREFLARHLGASSRQQLRDDQLLQFNLLLEEALLGSGA
ncbi:MAG: hypothetical protein VKO65_09800 [Cyanobacteriota bacterium]|nr:hypothetical protein [Cyanobacteriota bacterium]